MKNIVVATSNKHKVQEIQEILKLQGYTVISADEAGGMPEVIEDGTTFEENACKKARKTALFLKQSVIADDSGLEVMALNNEPGIFSARYAGEGGNDGRNVQKLLANMKDITDRRARFVCVIAAADSQGNIITTARGEVYGKIALAPAGNGGFGYDPVFIPDGYDKTFGELPQEIKNQLSHRGNALKSLILP